MENRTAASSNIYETDHIRRNECYRENLRKLW